ncbi:MAG: hypothetical protein ACOC1F_02095 [Myxococcota bacterium]
MGLKAFVLGLRSSTRRRMHPGKARPGRCAGCGHHKGPYQGAGTKGCYVDLDLYPNRCQRFWSSTEVSGSSPKAMWTVDFATGAVEPRTRGLLGIKCVKPKAGVAPSPSHDAPPSGSPPPNADKPAPAPATPTDWDDPPGDPSEGEVCIGHYDDVRACCERKGKRLPTLDELKSLMAGCNPPPDYVCTPGGHPTRRDGCYLKSGFVSFKGYKCGKEDTVHTYWASDPTPGQPKTAPFVNVANGYVSTRERPYTHVRVGRCVK